MPDITLNVFLTLHTVYQFFEKKWMYVITAYMMYEPHSHTLWYHTTLWHSHTLYSCHHTQYNCRRIHCRWDITYRLLIRARLQHVWYQTTICRHHMNSMWYHNHYYWHQRLYSWHHIHLIELFETKLILFVCFLASESSCYPDVTWCIGKIEMQ